MKEISAGIILYTTINNERKYLIIKDFHNNYGFPKGHLELNETPMQAAIREVKEEVGIDVVIDNDFLETVEYVMPNNIEKIVYYYLAEYHNQIPNKQIEEVQEILLLNLSDSLNLLTFDNVKQILIKADQY